MLSTGESEKAKLKSRGHDKDRTIILSVTGKVEVFSAFRYFPGHVGFNGQEGWPASSHTRQSHPSGSGLLKIKARNRFTN